MQSNGGNGGQPRLPSRRTMALCSCEHCALNFQKATRPSQVDKLPASTKASHSLAPELWGWRADPSTPPHGPTGLLQVSQLPIFLAILPTASNRCTPVYQSHFFSPTLRDQAYSEQSASTFTSSSLPFRFRSCPDPQAAIEDGTNVGPTIGDWVSRASARNR